ncbi:proline-rich protein Rad9 protein [Ceratobasidium sp. AG-Ba]|nr:proline-rich protein Rad9 protein [Ceratobasidium sp. AG-Ba]
MDPRNMTPLVASASTPDPQALMAAYPFASATPSAHVARHLSTLSNASSMPSFISHGQQHYQNDHQARQYAARALESEARQQNAYQGYAPPARWASSDYAAPVDSYAKHTYGSEQTHGYNHSSQYQYSSQQYPSSGTYPHETQSLAQRSSSQYQDSSSVHHQHNLKPQSYSYSQQYHTENSGNYQSSTLSGPTGVHNSQHYPRGAQQQSSQHAYSSSVPAAYGSQPTISSTYPSQAQTRSSYSRHPSSATLYHTQSNPHTHSAPSDSISSSFLAPLASHEFAPRFTQPVSTLTRHSSDAQVRYTENGTQSYSTGTDRYPANPNSNLQNAYAATSSSSYSTVPPPSGSGSLQRSVSLDQHQRQSDSGQGLGFGYAPTSGTSNRSAETYGEQVRDQSRAGQAVQDHGQPQAAYSNQGWDGGQQSLSQSGYYGAARAELEIKRQGSATSDQRCDLSGGYQNPDGHQARPSNGLGISNFFQQQALQVQTNQAAHPTHSRAHPNSHAHGARAAQRSSRDGYSVRPHNEDSQTENKYPTQAQPWHAQATAFSSSREQPQEPSSQQLQPYTESPQTQAQTLVASEPHLTQAPAASHVTHPIQPIQSPTDLPQAQYAGLAEGQSPIQGYQQPGQAPASSQPTESQVQAPALPHTQSQTQSRSIYAPLAGRPIRGRGTGRQHHTGQQRVLQGGPPRILTPPQPPPAQAPLPQQPQRWTKNVPVRHVQQSQLQRSAQPEGVTSFQQPARDTPMEYAVPAKPLSAHNPDVSDATATYPDSPPPPYEPLMRERIKKPQDGLTQNQEANGHTAQPQDLSQRPQLPAPQRSTITPTQQVQQTPAIRIGQQEPTPNHIAQDSAAHFEAFLSSVVPEKPKPSSSVQPVPVKATNAPRRPPLPPKASTSESSSSATRPRMSPVVELPSTNFMTPRKEKKWREPRREIATDSPPVRDTSSPDLLTLSPMKRKRDPESEPGTRTVKRMMSMTLDNTKTPTSSRMHDATMRTPGSGTRTPGKFATMPSSRMKLVVEMPPRKAPTGNSSDVSPEQQRAMMGMSTGKRDVHLEKLCTLIDEMIEAEDNLDPEAAAENGGPTEWFSPRTSDWSSPLLAPGVISRLTQLAARRGARLSEVDTGNLVRVLKMLGRSVAKGEDLDPFGSLLGGGGEEEVEEEEPKEEVELGDDAFARLTNALETAKEAVVAADCVFAILSADKLPKQLYSEDLITSCLSAVKNQLSSIIYPYVETASDIHGHSPPLLLHVAQNSSPSAVDHRNLLGEIFRALNAVLPRITALANHGISETMVIQAAFIGIGPFFVVEVTNEKGSKSSAADKKNAGRIQVLDILGGSTSMRGLRLTALGLVRALFANYESQRAWIVEEILSSLIKLPDMKLKAGQFKLRDGATIHVVSALLFQLVQTSAHDVRIHAQRLSRKRREAIADASASSFMENGKQPLLDEHDREEAHLYLNGLESATKTAKTIVLFLTQRTGKNKNTKSTNEAEYRSIFDNLIQDILVVLNWPEWPAANLLMGIVCKFMLSSLEDVKSSSDSAAKNMALDHLGEIATRLRETHLTLQLPFETSVKPLEEATLDDLIIAHSDVYAHLSKRSSDDQAYDSARELTAATWAQELATCLRQCDSILSKVGEDEDMEGPGDNNLPELASRIKAALRGVWNEGANDMFGASTDAEIKRVDDLAERFGGTQGLRNAFEPILGAIISSLDAPAVFMRTKALRALGLIVTKDQSILKQNNVRRAIESHLMDSSPAVRDAAVELIGKYLVLSPELVDDYYPQIANRIADTGLAVRKRVIKLLKSLYSLKLVLRMLDEDDGIKDLAISSIEELWFLDGNDSNSNRRGAGRESGTNNSSYMTSKISVIMGVNANFRDRHSPLEDLLHEIIVKKGDKDAGLIVQRYIDVCDALIDTLVDAQEIPGFSVVNCIRTVHVFTAAHPTVMSTRKAGVLLPYLKSGSTADDQAIADYLLKIFRSCIPRMPAGTSKFGTELQQTLEPMVIKPSGATGVAALPETVACLCAVVHHITHDYQRLVALLRSCNARLAQALAKPNQPTAQEIATLSILALIVSLLGEHSDFDKIRETHPALKPSIDSINQASLSP